MVGKLVNEVKNTKDWIFDSIFLKEENPVEEESLKFEGKSPNLDVYGLNEIFK
jgi:hypothetical protein